MTALTAELTTQDEDMDAFDVDVASQLQGPLILLGGGSPEDTVSDFISDLPPRPIADRLIRKFFEVDEPAWGKLYDLELTVE